MSETIKKAGAYTKGATIGGVAGFVIAKLANKNWLIGATIGGIIGGYIAHRFLEASDDTEKVQFKHYS